MGAGNQEHRAEQRNAGDESLIWCSCPGGEIAASVSDGIYNELLGIDDHVKYIV